MPICIMFYLAPYASDISFEFTPPLFDWQAVSEQTDKTQGIPILAIVLVQYWEIEN